MARLRFPLSVWTSAEFSSALASSELSQLPSLTPSFFAPGIQAPPGVSPVRGYLVACRNRQPACQQGIAAINSSTVSGARADPSGKAQLPGVPPGTYYFFCLGSYNKQLFKWDFQVQLKPGANSVTHDQHNAVAVN